MFYLIHLSGLGFTWIYRQYRFLSIRAHRSNHSSSPHIKGTVYRQGQDRREEGASFDSFLFHLFIRTNPSTLVLYYILYHQSHQLALRLMEFKMNLADWFGSCCVYPLYKNIKKERASRKPLLHKWRSSFSEVKGFSDHSSILAVISHQTKQNRHASDPYSLGRCDYRILIYFLIQAFFVACQYPLAFERLRGPYMFY